MWTFILRKLIYNIPVYLSIILLLMVLLRVRNPVYSYLGKNATSEQKTELLREMGLEQQRRVTHRRPW